MKLTYIQASVPIKRPGSDKYEKAEMPALGAYLEPGDDIDECYAQLREKVIQMALKVFGAPPEKTIEEEQIIIVKKEVEENETGDLPF